MNSDDDQTPEGVTEIPFSSWMVLPGPPGTCPECAVAHDPQQPHDQQSLTYQYSFRLAEAKAGRPERWPTWADAMAHCPPEVQAMWREALASRGVTVD